MRPGLAGGLFAFVISLAVASLLWWVAPHVMRSMSSEEPVAVSDVGEWIAMGLVALGLLLVARAVVLLTARVFAGPEQGAQVAPLGAATVLQRKKGGPPWAPSLRARASHEAGHAVVAHELGRRLLYATIEEDALTGSGGHVAFETEGRVPGLEEAAISLAGHLAQGEPHDVRLSKPGDDYDRALREALMLSLDDPSRTLAETLDEAAALARRVLDIRTRDVSAVAEELLKRRTLGSAELERLLGPQRKADPEKSQGDAEEAS